MSVKKMLKLLFRTKKMNDNAMAPDYSMIKDGKIIKNEISIEECSKLTYFSRSKEFTSFLNRPELCTIFEDSRLYTYDNVENRIQRERIH